ncbi:hemerythrin domain-containing protein [Kitasatospora sp. MAP5-34]|uniref:hemerythrin domain-containing protein n=1 Tax=Kitasatospora sp. MAP5-34 TaxID=3035102 RepID=UPI002476B854|nr:hemerythrin domain-containing protein [Kitasatospora sp. MAP5-34]MDH6574639.1 hemerythrin superfamily protein [Kitasatospora sp. MAP5-34]
MVREGDILHELTADHALTAVTFSRIVALPVGDQERKTLVDEVTADLVRHSVTEEHYLYPLVHRLPGGAAIVDRELLSHRAVEALLSELASRTARTPDFDRLVAQLIEKVTRHNGEEEARIFPVLAEAVSPVRLFELGERARRLKALLVNRAEAIMRRPS